MDAVLYLALRDEMQQDALRVERQIDELRAVESFLLRRIPATKLLASYRAVLQDLAAEISRAENEHAELFRLSRFVTRALVTTYGKDPKPVPFAKSVPLDSAKSQEPATGNGTLRAVPQSPSQNPPATTNAGKSPTRMGGPDFDKANAPLVAATDKDNALDAAPLAMFLEDSPTQCEPPTVVFDQNGFPMNAATHASEQALVEFPKAAIKTEK